MQILVYFSMRIILQIRVWGHIFSIFLQIMLHELPFHMFFLCYSNNVLEHTFDVLTKFSHVIVT